MCHQITRPGVPSVDPPPYKFFPYLRGTIDLNASCWISPGVTPSPPSLAWTDQPNGTRLVHTMFAVATGLVMLGDLIGGWELLLIVAVVLILFGAKRLQDIRKGFGDG